MYIYKPLVAKWPRCFKDILSLYKYNLLEPGQNIYVIQGTQFLGLLHESQCTSPPEA